MVILLACNVMVGKWADSRLAEWFSVRAHLKSSLCPPRHAPPADVQRAPRRPLDRASPLPPPVLLAVRPPPR